MDFKSMLRREIGDFITNEMENDDSPVAVSSPSEAD